MSPRPLTDRLEKRIGYSFAEKRLLDQALVHSSFAYERPGQGAIDNQVLEFLGDSVIGLVTADFLHSQYPSLREGELSKLRAVAASTEALSLLARKIRLDKFLLLGKGEEQSGGRKKRTILAGAFEALIGAIYKDGGLREARRLLLPLLEESFKKIKSEPFHINNFKSALQEYFQKHDLPAPVYRTVEAKGPDHDKTFIVEVCSNGRGLAKAKGESKKDAQQRAAQKALKRLLGRRLKELPGEMFIVKKD